MLAHIADEAGIVLRRDVIALGVDDNFLYRAVRSGELHRLRQGAYVLTTSWLQASRVERHRLLSAAVMRQYGDDVALSHTSACVEQGGPDWGLDLRTVHLTNLLGVGERNAAKVVHHRGTCRVDDVTRSEGFWITSPTRTALDTASIATRQAAVCVLDWYLHQGMTDRDQLEAGFARMKDWPDTLPLHVILRVCDGRSESVGESRTRLLIIDHRLPMPIPQFEIFHPSGLLAGRVDFAWPEHRLILEFDGRQKYLALRRAGETIEEAVLREKAREDRLRELTGWMMIRLTWRDLEHPAATAARIQRALASRAA